MNTVEKLSQEIKTLPEEQAREVLDFVGFLKARRAACGADVRQAALEGLARMRGRYKAMKFDRDGLHDRASLR